MSKAPKADEEGALFRQAMEGVKPLGKASKAPDDHRSATQRKRSIPDDMAMKRTPRRAFADLPNATLVRGSSAVEFFHRSLPYRDRTRLKKGQIPIDANLDLHGMTLEVAREAFSTFLQRAQANAWRCVRIIHGKGGADTPPVLKNAVIQWLPQSPCVLAYCSARGQEGGTGALYVLIRGEKT